MVFSMKKICICLTCLTLILVACHGGAALPLSENRFESGLTHNLDNYSPLNILSIVEDEPKNIVPIQISPGIFDLGATLFSESELYASARVDLFGSARILSGNRLLITDAIEGKSVIYHYYTGDVSHRFSSALRRLGMEHFYTKEQNSEGRYTIILYDSEFNVLAEHITAQPAIPVIDSIHILYESRASIRMRNTRTNEEVKISVGDLSPKPEHGGGMVWWDFDGQWVFFVANHAPEGTPQFSELWMRAVGAYNLITGQYIFSEDFPQTFAGIPEAFGNGSVIFWQDGTAFGTDGTYSIVVDATNSDIRIVDVGITTNHISDNGRFLVAVDAVSIEWENDIFDFPVLNTTLSQIILYDLYTLTPLLSRDFEPLIGVMAGSFGGGISISESGRYVFLRGFVYEGEIRRQSLFKIEMI